MLVPRTITIPKLWRTSYWESIDSPWHAKQIMSSRMMSTLIYHINPPISAFQLSSPVLLHDTKKKNSKIVPEQWWLEHKVSSLQNVHFRGCYYVNFGSHPKVLRCCPAMIPGLSSHFLPSMPSSGGRLSAKLSVSSWHKSKVRSSRFQTQTPNVWYICLQFVNLYGKCR